MVRTTRLRLRTHQETPTAWLGPRIRRWRAFEESGIGEARQGEFRLFERSELNQDWSPIDDPRLTVWEVLQYLVAALEKSESEAAELLHTLGGNGDRARQLAYVLYQKANDKGWTTEAGAYNALITAWPSLQVSAEAAAATPVQAQIFSP